MGWSFCAGYASQRSSPAVRSRQRKSRAPADSVDISSGRGFAYWRKSVTSRSSLFRRPRRADAPPTELDRVLEGQTLQQEVADNRIVRAIVDRCLPKLSLPGLVTTSTEEVVWIADWCHRKNIPYRVERRQYPTALVGDPICFVKIGKG